MAHYSSSSFVSASFGAPPLPTTPPPFHFENLNASSSAGARPTATTQHLNDCAQEQGVAAGRNLQNGSFSYENTWLKLGRSLPEEYITKNLTLCDVDHHQCRLLLPKHFVEAILRSMDRTAAVQCRSPDGFPIDVFDVDDNRSFELRLKYWNASKSYVLIGGWRPDFIIRKGLKEGDKVGLTYYDSKLYFKHFENHNVLD